jgi:WD40 repeat protein
VAQRAAPNVVDNSVNVLHRSRRKAVAKQITDTFTIAIKGQPDAYTIEADGPQAIRADPHPFSWSPSPEHEATIAALTGEKARVSPEAIRELGRALHHAVFTPPIATAFGRAQGSVGADSGLRLRLRIEAPELASLPWEALHDGQDFVSTRSDSPLVRTLPSQDGVQAIKRLQVRGALRILFVGASPAGLPALEIEQTAVQLRQLLAEAINRKHIVLDVLTNATLPELRSQLLQDYHILYFAGHGSPEGIYLDDGQGEVDEASGQRLAGDPYLVSAETLARELEGKPTRLVFLAACNTSALLDEKSGLLASFAQTLARLAMLPAIVAMQYSISDKQAHQLTARFFESLAAFYPVDVALAEARKSLIRRGQAGRDVIAPVMYLQAEDGALFQRARNWLAIGLSVALVVVIALGIVAAFRAQQSQQQAQLEATGRVIAESTRQVETTRRAFAENTARAEATERAFARATAEAEAENRAIAQAQSTARQLALEAQAALDNTGTGLVRSVLLALESLRLHPTLEGDLALRRGLYLLPSRLLVHAGPEDRVDSAIFSPDGRRVALQKEGTVWVLETTTGKEIARLEHEDLVPALAFSPDGRWLASGCWDGIARVWDVAAGQEVARMLHRDPYGVTQVMAVAFSPDEQWLASVNKGGKDNTVWVWEVATGREVAHVEQEEAWSVAFSPDGKWVLSEGQVWEAATGQEVAQLGYAAAFSPDRRWAVSGDRVWEVATEQEVSRMEHEGSAPVFAFSPDGQWIVSGLEISPVSGEAVLWEVATGRKLVQVQHGGGVIAVAFSPDGRWAASGSRDGTMRVWETTTGREVARMEHEGPVGDVAFGPDGQWLASGSWDGTVRVWNIAAERDIAPMKHEQAVWGVAFSPDGQRLASGSWDGTVGVWDVASRQQVARMSQENPWGVDRVWGVAFNPDGQLVVSGDEHMVRVWKVATGEEVVRMLHDFGAVVSVDVSPDGRWVASGGWDGTARVWEVATGGEVARMEHDSQWSHGGWVQAVAFSPDGRWVASGSRDSTVRVWEVETGWEIARVVHEGEVQAVAFSPDGRLVASGTWDGVSVWESATGQEVAWMPHDHSVWTVAFSPDGRLLASATGRDFGSGAVRVWDIATGEEVVRIENESVIRTVVFSPDGHCLATGSDDGTVRMWSLRLEDLTAEACARLPRNLTREEWQLYFGEDEPYRPTCPDLPMPEE